MGLKRGQKPVKHKWKGGVVCGKEREGKAWRRSKERRLQGVVKLKKEVKLN